MNKDNFIAELCKMTKEEIHEYIKNNGKKPKLIQLYRKIQDNKKSTK